MGNPPVLRLWICRLAAVDIRSRSDSVGETATAIKLVTLKKGRRFAHEISIDPVKASENLDSDQGLKIPDNRGVRTGGGSFRL